MPCSAAVSAAVSVACSVWELQVVMMIDNSKCLKTRLMLQLNFLLDIVLIGN